MEHESNENLKVEISDGILFSDIYKKSYIPLNLIEEIKKADILLLPYEGFRGRTDCLFPEETYKFYEYLSDRLKGTKVKLEICSSDEEYKELELHADVINLVHIIVNSFALPTLIGIITNYLYDKLRQYNRKDLNANINITVEKNGKSKAIKFEGSIENFERAMKSLHEHLK